MRPPNHDGTGHEASIRIHFHNANHNWRDSKDDELIKKGRRQQNQCGPIRRPELFTVAKQPEMPC
jgi:hypothetical protein